MPPAEQAAPWPSVAHPAEQPRAAAGSSRKQHKRGLPPPPRSARLVPHARHGDRGDGAGDGDGDGDDDGADGLLPKYVRYADLVAAGICRNWPALLRLVDTEGFPEGVWLGRNTRAWSLDAVQAWLKTRPTARKPRRYRRQPKGTEATA
jgi:predicted DNA-binding transcriptional regulator AlpA